MTLRTGLWCLPLFALVAACSSDDKTAATTVANATTIAATATTTTALAATTTVASGPADGKVGGVALHVGSQFAQYEPLSRAWRLHLVDGAHTCSEDLASLEPAVGIDFDASDEADVPNVGEQTDVGVVFISADPAAGGPVTTTIGVVLDLKAVDATPGSHWTGHLKVEPFEDALGTDSIDIALNALVCPPVPA